MQLSTENVNTIAKECLLSPEDPRTQQMKDLVLANTPFGAVREKATDLGLLVVEGIARNMVFDKAKLEARRDDVKEMLKQLPKEFRKDNAGGYSFLKMTVRASDDETWAQQPTAEVLLCLALAAGMGEYCMSKEMWKALPGGVPYVVFDVS